MSAPQPLANSPFTAEERWPRVLVVDDIEDNREILRRRLMAARFEVVTACSGAECLEVLGESPFDIVLLDHMMPGMDGIETLTAIREKWPKTVLPVIMVTARDDDPLIVKAFDIGANDFVAKPFSFPVLAARTRAQLEAAKK
ncbi:MAG: response regulator [Hyphomonadaceae bacterium]|nr:response regulator [Hyphomonadaceae bacterium]